MATTYVVDASVLGHYFGTDIHAGGKDFGGENVRRRSVIYS